MLFVPSVLGTGFMRKKMDEVFLFKWNNFQNNVTNSFKGLREENDFYDVTLVSDDNQQVSAHKIVLSASSEYFKTILKTNKHSHPLLCLNQIDSSDLKNILDFIYNGELQIYPDQLDKFLNNAKRFQLQGLIHQKISTKVEHIEGDIKQCDDQFQCNVEKWEEVEQFDESSKMSDCPEYDKIVQEAKDLKKNQKLLKEIIKKKVNIEAECFENMEQLDQKIDEMIENNGYNNKKCKICGKISIGSSQARTHAETHIQGLSFPCELCHKSFRTRQSLRHHNNKFH